MDQFIYNFFLDNLQQKFNKNLRVVITIEMWTLFA